MTKTSMMENNKVLLSLCQDMLRAQSYSGEEADVVAVMKRFCEVSAFTDTYIDKYGNCICRIKGKRPGPIVLFDGHIDTVPVPDPTTWKHDPFGGEIEDGKIYGRGASDMKGAIASALVAAKRYAEDNEYDFAGEIYIAGVVCEERFEGVSAREISQRLNPDYVIIGEASNLNLKIGQRGRAEIIVETVGIPAHTANPDKGVNAVYKMSKIIEQIQKLKPPVQEMLGEGIMELSDIKSSPYPGASVVPSYCKATFDRRLLAGETKQSVLAPIEEMLNDMRLKDPSIKAKVSYAVYELTCYTGEPICGDGFYPAWLFNEE
jgi:putative selenium metabolism hydrolase